MSPDAPEVREGSHDETSSAAVTDRRPTAQRKRGVVVARVVRAMARRDAASGDTGGRRGAERDTVDLAGRS